MTPLMEHLGINHNEYCIPEHSLVGTRSVIYLADCSIILIAARGVQEKETKDIGLRFGTIHQNTNSLGSSKRLGEDCSGI